MGQKVDDILPLFKSPFRTWLRLTDRLGEVIRFYRPIVDGNDEKELDLPSFEELIDSSNAWDIPIDLFGNRVLNDTERGRNPERATRSECHQIRSNSQDMITPSFGRTQALEENEETYMNVSSIDQRQIGSDPSANFHDLIDSPGIMSGNIEDFDVFFDNFPDINFPRSSDQFILDFDMLNS
ncbi:Transcription factor [Penicillium lagena]|uniref:Transcription factor n=1 Tax=Penicillium lagena TaxID=94218 RepID=UPI0025410260|nr:Transcription factor [Penicillium lagena]KAJ5606662.1 Transcription factor [Penicillium lagena]